MYFRDSLHIKKLAECTEQFNKGKIDCDTAFTMQKQILRYEIDDPEFLGFALENFNEMMEALLMKTYTSGMLQVYPMDYLAGLSDGLLGG